MVSILLVILLVPMYAVLWLTEINEYFVGIMYILCLIAIKCWDYHYNIKRKPIMHSMARVKSKRASKMGCSIFFLLTDEGTVWLRVSKKQFNAIKERDVVEIKYQGWLLHSLKRAKNEDAIVNSEYFKDKRKKK